MPPCPACQKLAKGSMCEPCARKEEAILAATSVSAMDEDVRIEARGPTTRAKSPLVNSAERPGKVLKADMATPLAAIPTFPAMISDGDKKAKGEKGKGKYGNKGKGRAKVGSSVGSEKGGDP